MDDIQQRNQRSPFDDAREPALFQPPFVLSCAEA
jgi:hypothetical protein